MRVNITYIQQLPADTKVQKIAPISSVHEVHHNPFQKQYNRPKDRRHADFKKVLDDSMKVYQKETFE